LSGRGGTSNTAPAIPIHWVRMRSHRTITCLLTLSGWLFTFSAAQDPDPEPESGSPRYRVDAYSSLYELRIVDPGGKTLRGLRIQDLEVRAGGRAGTLQYLEERERSLMSLAILVDLGSSMDEAAIRAAKQAVFELIHLLQPEDEILLGIYNREVEFLVELTSDRLALVEGLNHLTTGARSGFWKRLAQGFGTAALTGLAVDEALLRLKQARHEVKAVLVFSAAFGNLGLGTADHLALAGARFFGVVWKNRVGDAFGLGGDRMARGYLLKESGGLVYDAEVILDRLELLAEVMSHSYLAAWTAGEGDSSEGVRPEFRVRGCADCRIASARRVAVKNPFY
jgi:hypothetical protein